MVVVNLEKFNLREQGTLLQLFQGIELIITVVERMSRSKLQGKINLVHWWGSDPEWTFKGWTFPGAALTLAGSQATTSASIKKLELFSIPPMSNSIQRVLTLYLRDDKVSFTPAIFNLLNEFYDHPNELAQVEMAIRKSERAS
jgi:hypothetical protein